MTTKIDPSTLPGRPCSVAAALQLVGERWSLLAIREVMFGNHQFRQIARNTGAPTDRLAARLKELVAAGVLERRQEPPSRHEGYYLTESGRDLAASVHALKQWGDRWAVTDAPMRLMHHDHVLVSRHVCAVCGEDVDGPLERQMTVAGWNAAGPVMAD